MHIPIARNLRIVDNLLVHYHGGCELGPRQRIMFFFDFEFYLFIDLFHNHFQSFGLLNIALMTANNTNPIELMYSVTSRIHVFVLDTVEFDGQFV